MKTILLPFIFILFFCSSSWAQQEKIDSLKLILDKTTIDTAKINVAYDLMFNTIDFEKVNDSVLIMIKHYQEKSKSLQYWEGYVKHKYAEGFYYSKQDERQKAIEIFSQNSKEAEKHKLFFWEIASNNALALEYTKVGKSDEAIKSYFKILSYLNSLKEMNKKQQSTKAVILNNIGLAYRNLSQFREAIQYYKKALASPKETLKVSLKALLYLNIGSGFEKIASKQNLPAYYDSALIYYQMSLKIREQFQFSKQGLARCYNNIGVIYKEKKEYTKALSYLNKALALKKESTNIASLASTLNNIANIYRLTQRVNESFPLLYQSIYLNQKSLNLEGLTNSYKSLMLSHRSLKSDSSFIYLDFYLTLKDSLNNDIKSQKVAEYEQRFNLQEKEIENNRLKQENLEAKIEKQQMAITSIIVGLTLLTIISSVSVSYRNTLKKKKLDEEKLKQNELEINELIKSESTFKEKAEVVEQVKEEWKTIFENFIKDKEIAFSKGKIPHKNPEYLKPFESVETYDIAESFTNNIREILEWVVTIRDEKRKEAEKKDIERLQKALKSLHKKKSAKLIDYIELVQNSFFYKRLLNQLQTEYPEINNASKEIFTLISLGISEDDIVKLMEFKTSNSYAQRKVRFAKALSKNLDAEIKSSQIVDWVINYTQKNTLS